MIIGICGHARHGKDTAADVLVNEFGYTKYHLAQKMKDCLNLIFGWSNDFIERHKEEVDSKWGISPRQVLRAFGTEFAQQTLCEMYPEFDMVTGRKLWVKSLLEEIPFQSNAVIADVRFLHEVEEIKNQGGIILKVYRSSHPADLSHGSERDIPNIKEDYLIMNDSTLSSYKGAVLEWMDWYENTGVI
jgi:hypothetical protein